MSLDEVLRAVQEHGLKVLLGMVTTGLAGCAAWAKNQFVWRRTIDAAMLAVLHDRLFAECLRILERPGVEITEDELENLEIMYRSYTKLGGNGTIKALMERVRTYCKIVPAVPLQGGGSVC